MRDEIIKRLQWKWPKDCITHSIYNIAPEIADAILALVEKENKLTINEENRLKLIKILQSVLFIRTDKDAMPNEWQRLTEKESSYLADTLIKYFAIPEIINADELTLEFFRKYLKLPNGTLEELCRKIEQLTQENKRYKEALKNIHALWFGDKANIYQYRLAIQDIASQALGKEE